MSILKEKSEKAKQPVSVLKKLEANGVDLTSLSDDIDEAEAEVKWLVKHPAFERKPVCIDTFLDDIRYLQAKKCRRVVRYKMRKIFGDQEYVDKNPKAVMKFDEVVDMEGIGSGKTFTASLFILYGLYRLLCLKSPQDYYGKSAESSISFMLMSTSEKNAKDVIFTEIGARIKENPYGFFATHYKPDPKITSQMNFPKNLYIIPGNSSETHFVGYNIFMAVIDECDDHKKTEEKNYVKEGYTAITRRIISRFPGYGGVIMIGSPKSVDGFMKTMYDRSVNDEKMLGFHFATWEALDEEEFDTNEKFKATDPKGKVHQIPVTYKRGYEINPERFWRDLGAQPSYTIEPFITMTARIEDAFDDMLITWDGTGQFPVGLTGNGRQEYIAHVDLGVNRNGSDHCGIALGHVVGSRKVVTFGGETVERPHIIIDFVARLSALSGDEIPISRARRIIMELNHLGYKLYRVQFDGWQSLDSQQILRKKGIRVKQVSVDKNMLAYEACKEAMYEGRLQYGRLLVSPEDGSGKKIDIIKKEFGKLRRIKGKKVDHPRGGSKDVTDAIAGVVIGLTETTQLHKIGIRYRPRYVEDELSLNNITRDNKKQYDEQYQKYRAKGYKQGAGGPRIVRSKSVW